MDAIAEQLLARLRSDPRDRDAYDALRAHLVHGHDLAAVADLLESWAVAHPDDRQGSSDAWTEAADAVLQSGGDRSRAKVLYRRALELNVLHPRAGERLRELLETDTDFQGLIEVLEPYARALEAAGGAPGYIAGLYERLAELWQHAFNRPDLAASFRERASVLRARPSRQLPIAQEDPRALIADLEGRVNSESSPDKRAALLSELARIREHQLGDLDGALEALRQARSLAPNDVLLMHQLATTSLAQAARSDAAIARVAHRRASELFYQLAQAVDSAQALAYLESALCSTPDHEGSLALLERIAPELGRAEVLPGYWVRFLAAAGDGPETDQRRVWLGRAYLRSEQLEDAIYCLQPAAEHRFEGAAELLQQAYDRLGSAQDFDVQPRGAAQSDSPGDAPSASPAPRRSAPQLEGPVAPASPPTGLSELRKAVRNALASRRGDEAAEYCRSILALDPADGEAFNLLESHLRKRGDYPALRELLVASTRSPTLAQGARRARLREVALLCESKLRDPEAALDAWREVVQLDPADREAAASFKRLLQRAQAWDELSAVLERDALATTDPTTKLERLRELLQLQREKRKDAAAAAEVLRRLHALTPDDSAVRTELCELLLLLERWSEAVPVLRECIARSTGAVDALRHSHALARTLHERLGAHDEAYRICAQILELNPSDINAFERMERLDIESGNQARLLSTLERRALLATKSERPLLLVRMAEIADSQLRDLERAATYLGEALDLAPENEAALALLTDMFERAGRFERLRQLLDERSKLDIQPATRALVLRRIAHISSERLHDDDAAAEAYRKLLALQEDEPALRFLRDFAARSGNLQELVDVLQRLAACVAEPSERRDLLFERATVLHERLATLPSAIASLRQILEQLDPAFEPAIDLLANLSVRSRDMQGLALALERRLSRSTDPDTRLPIVRRLTELYSDELADPERTVSALQRWAREDGLDPEPHRRLQVVLRELARWPELLQTLDALNERERDPEAREQAVLAAARIASDQLADLPGAWRRLLPLVELGQREATQMLQALAQLHGRQAELAALYVRLAQKNEEPALAAKHWRAATDVFEHELQDFGQAFEASLRLLASDLLDLDSLARVDQLAIKTRSFRRLGQVYDRLLKQDQSEREKLSLLRRLIELLEADQPEDALDRVLQACRLAPLDEALLQRAEALAQRTHRNDELLPLYDARCALSEDENVKLQLLLRAVQLCDGALRDREQAVGYLRKALAVSLESPQAQQQLEAIARELDLARPELGKDAARRALVQLERDAAAHAPPQLAERLLLRAADLLRVELDDERSAFDMLLHGPCLLSPSGAIYAAVRAMANTRGRLDAIDAQLARMLEDATDLETSVAVLRQRAALLEEVLGRFQDAAAVYGKLWQLAPDDAHASERLRVNLRRAGRYQELIAALHKQLERGVEPAHRIALLKEIASTWENDLKNRWEAADAWKEVLQVSPQDAEATAGLSRSRAHSSPPETAASPASKPPVTRPGSAASQERPAESRPATPRPTRAPSEPSDSLDPGASDDEDGDDLAALEAVVDGRRTPGVDELDAFNDEDAASMGELDVRQALPLPPAKTSVRPARAGDRPTPPPPPRTPLAPGEGLRTPPPLPKARPPRPVNE